MPIELLEAIMADDVDTVKRFLERGYHSSATDPNFGSVSAFETSLYGAAQGKTCKVFRLFLENGADINPLHNFKPPLLHAVILGSVEVCRALIEYGADVNGVGINTPLYYAAIGMYLGRNTAAYAEVVNLLRHSGARIGVIEAALLGETTALMAALQTLDDINPSETCVPTPLLLAVMGGHEETVRLLLELGADVNGRACIDGQTESCISPLALAALLGHTQIVRLLMAAHADVYKTYKTNYTAGTYAAECGHLDVITLLDGAIDTDKTSIRQKWFRRAIRFGHHEIVQWLVDQGADIEKLIQDESAQLLRDALHCDAGIAFSYGGFSLFNIELHDRLSYPGNQEGALIVLRLLVELGADINGKETRGVMTGATPLMRASKLETVRFLVGHGADIHAQDVRGFNILDYAKCRVDYHKPSLEENDQEEAVQIVAFLEELYARSA